MPMHAGQRLGEYEIVGAIGQGGMGEVYRARDTSLGRDVAIKVLPEGLSQDPDRYARFEREARLLAQLNHPNVATLYGFRDGFLVMELVDGETLSERIARGPLRLEEAIALFLQIAEGLEAAHEKGIVHRDLKPANVKVTPEGKIKILDFGLAKALAPDGAADTSQSPTLTRDTALGAILGTASYMSPEQARGKTVDKRTDVWAFGCCLFEALTGRKAFDGETVSDVVSAVLRVEPSLEELPRSVRGLVGRCLRKEARERLRDIGDAKHALADGALSDSEDRTTTAKWRPPSLLVAGAFIGALAALFLVKGTEELSPSTSIPSVRFTLNVPIDSSHPKGTRVALSPDGRLLLWRSRDGLVVRHLDRFESRTVPDTRDAWYPSFSPDGASVLFDEDGALKKLSLLDGSVLTLCSSPGFRGAHWIEDGTVFFVDREGLSRIHTSGGTPERIAQLLRPEGLYALPGGEAVLLSVRQGEGSGLDIVVTKTGERTSLLADATTPRYARGYLFFERDEAIYSVRFDPARLELEGEPVRVHEDVEKSPYDRQAAFDVSPSGHLAYLPSGDLAALSSLVWVDRDGREAPAFEDPRPYRAPPRLAPSGERLAITTVGPPHLWIVDMARGSYRRLTVDPGYPPVWSSGGERIFYTAFPGGAPPRVTARPADGSDEPTPLATNRGGTYPESATPDGQHLFLKRRSEAGDWDILLLRVDGESESTPLLSSPSNEFGAAISPDGSLLAFVTDESGREEVVVTPFPDVGARIAVSADGGTQPVWSVASDELYYRRGGAIMAARRAADLQFSPPVVLFERDEDPREYQMTFGGEGLPTYDVAPDGRFLMFQPGPPIETEIHVVVNWLDELERSRSRAND